MVRFIQINAPIAFQPLLNVASNARAARISAKCGMNNVVLLCRMERQRIQDVEVISVTPRCRKRHSRPYEPRSMQVKDHLNAALRDTLVSEPWLVRVITLVKPQANVRGKGRANGRRHKFVIYRHVESNGGDTHLPILSLTITRGREVQNEMIISRLTYLPRRTTTRRDSIVCVEPNESSRVVAGRPVPSICQHRLITISTSIVRATYAASTTVVASTRVLCKANIRCRCVIPSTSCDEDVFIKVGVHSFLRPYGRLQTVTMGHRGVNLIYKRFVVGRRLATSYLVRSERFCPIARLQRAICRGGVRVLGRNIVPCFVVNGMILSVLGTAIVSRHCVVRHRVPRAKVLPSSSQRRGF